MQERVTRAYVRAVELVSAIYRHREFPAYSRPRLAAFQLLYFLGIALPDNWAPQPTDSTGKEKEVHLVQLAAISDEFKKVAAEVAKTATLNIVKIERVQNPTLYKAYVVKRQRMDEKDGSREKQLFHGTAGASCTNINSFGFNRSFCGKNGRSI